MTYYQALGISVSDLKFVPILYGPVVYLTTRAITGAGEAVADAIGPSEAACAQNRARVEATLDAQTAELDRDWKPTGFYRIEDISRMIDEVLKLLVNAANATRDAMAGYFTYKFSLKDALGKVQSKMAESIVFTNAISAARDRGVRVIDAPSFRRWVVTSMNRASLAYGHVAYMACLKPALVSALETAFKISRAIIALGKAMVKATIALGEQILKVPDLLGQIWKYGKWGTVAVAAYYAARYLKQHRK
jgi:hypothetical protein